MKLQKGSNIPSNIRIYLKETVHLARKEFLDTLPRDIVQEMVRRRIKELRSAGYEIPEHAK